MKTALKIIFTAILGIMLYVTIAASLDRSVAQAFRELWPDLWFQATMCDTYFAFFVICLWAAYKEKSLAGKILWPAAILVLGNIAIAPYMLIQLFRLKPGDPVGKIWTRNF